MPTIWKHGMENDWCHVCGNRSAETADVWYPQNAEHATKAQHKSTAASAKYVRICSDCASKILDAAKATDKFCDGDDDPGAYIDDSHPAYGPTVAGYLAGIQHLAKIHATPFNFDLFCKGLKGGAKCLATNCSFHSLSKSTMRLTIPYSHRHLVPVFIKSLHSEVLLHVANVGLEIMLGMENENE